MRTRRHITVRIAINCSANFDATVIALFKIVSDNRINNSSRRSAGNVDTMGISHISVNLEGDRVFGSQDSACESLFTFPLVFTFTNFTFMNLRVHEAARKASRGLDLKTSSTWSELPLTALFLMIG